MNKKNNIKFKDLLENNSFPEQSDTYSPLSKEEKKNLINTIGNYNSFRNSLKSTNVYSTVDKLLEAVVLAERYVMSECNEWLEADMAQKDLKDVKKIIEKMKAEADKIKSVEHNIERLYEDAGVRLDRYFEIK